MWIIRSIPMLVTMLAGLASAVGQEYPKLSPYPALRWRPEVLMDGRWYELRAINGQSVGDIRAFAQHQYGDIWQKRFREDIVQVLSEMGHPPGDHVNLLVRDPQTNEKRRLEQVPLTESNRRALMRRTPQRPLTGQDLRAALDDFETALNERWSYRHANNADFEAAIAALRSRVTDELSPTDFAIELQKIVALGIDGHARVGGYRLPSERYLPILIEPVGDRFVAFHPDRSGFLADRYPYVTRIDGRRIGEWCQAAAALVPNGSPQYVRRHALRQLRAVDYWRGVLGLARQDTVEVELLSADGRTRQTVTLAALERQPAYGTWPRGESHMLADNVGYLRLPRMDDDAVQEIRTWLPRFRDTVGLVVDVRDNGGGSRAALRELHAYLAAPDDPPRVCNAAVYRLHPAHEDDHLAARFMHRADADEWTATERAAIEAFARDFKPAWRPPAEQFSDWHYLVLRRRAAPDAFHYAKPVVVLMNAKCFSATDIFLAGLKGLPNVTLLGTPSGGGSARSQRVRLGRTPYSLRIGSMASYRPDGRLFDGNGVQPDVVVEPAPEYFIGGKDNALAEALQCIAGE